MRERKYVKFRVDMYEDTKFKIIDMKPERDAIHYIWSRIVLLAGKANLVGDLYLSRSIPYTIETLAIEFNRDIAQVKLALDLFIELEMIEFTEDKVYRVKNFAKHQNIKVKGKEIAKNKEETNNNIVRKLDNKTIGNAVESAREAKGGNLEINKGRKKNKKKDDIVNFSDIDEEIKDEIKEETKDDTICCIEGITPLRKDESKILEWSFG